jgi:hypothetical protein
MLFVGIDVSKDPSSAQELDQERKKLFYLEFQMDGEGFPRFLRTMKNNCRNLSEVTVTMESSKEKRKVCHPKRLSLLLLINC